MCNHWFRLDSSSFNMILQLIRRHPRVSRKDTKFRKCIQADKRLAMALIWLAHGIPFKVLGDMFGVGTSTACNVVHDTVHAMADILPRKFIKFPVKAACPPKKSWLISRSLGECRVVPGPSMDASFLSLSVVLGCVGAAYQWHSGAFPHRLPFVSYFPWIVFENYRIRSNMGSRPRIGFDPKTLRIRSTKTLENHQNAPIQSGVNCL